jgi:capsid protein
MSRKRHHGNRPRPQSPAAAAPAPRSVMETVRPFTALSTFDAARWSDRRTQVPFFSKDTKFDLTGWDLQWVRAKSRYFYSNNGLACGLIDGLANLIGYLRPRPTSPNADWNKRMSTLFTDLAFNPLVFDRAGKYDFRQWQIQNNICRLKDGDMLSVLTETPGGIARVAIYESHQIGTPAGGIADVKKIQDGIFKDDFGRMNGLAIIDPTDLTKYSYVAPNDAIFFARFRSPSQCRGFPVLSNVLNHLHDRVDIWANFKTNMKASSEVLMYEKRAADSTSPLQRNIFGATQTVNAGTVVTPTNQTGLSDSTDGNNPPINRTVVYDVEALKQQGSIPELAPGNSLELLHDTRPAPDQRAFLDDLVRDICIGAGVDSEIIWNIIGQTGPSVRYLMAKLKRFITQEHVRLQLICQRFYVYFVAKAIKNGLIESTDQWWRCQWIPQADMTIDEGRIGKLQIDQLRIMATTHDEIWHGAGGDADDAYDAHLDRMARWRDKAVARGFTGGLADVIPGFYQGLPKQITVDDGASGPEPDGDETNQPPRKAA